MSIAQATSLIDDLVKAKIPKKTATDLVEFVEQHQSEKTNFKLNIILWIMGLGFGFVLSLIIYTNNRIDNLEKKIDLNLNELEKKIDLNLNELEKKIDMSRHELEKKIDANHKQIINILLKQK